MEKTYDSYRPRKRQPIVKILLTGFLVLPALAATIWFFPSLVSSLKPSSSQSTAVTTAVAVLTSKNGVTGTIRFSQQTPLSPVTVQGDVKNLSGTQHGFHVHEYGDLTKDCDSTQKHFNPFDKKHGLPTDQIRHVGDLGNIQADEFGNANFTIADLQISLYGRQGIIGRAVVVHQNMDMGSGGDETGNSGPRVACGVIGITLI